MQRPFTQEHVLDKYLKGMRNAAKRAEEYCWERLNEEGATDSMKLKVIATINDIKRLDNLITEIQSDFINKTGA